MGGVLGIRVSTAGTAEKQDQNKTVNGNTKTLLTSSPPKGPHPCPL